MDFAKNFTKEWLDAWNSHDLDRIFSHYEGDIEFKSPLIVEKYQDRTGTIRSRKKLKEYFGIWLANYPSLKFELIDMGIGVHALTLYYKNARGGKTSEYFEFSESGKVTRSFSCYS